MVENSHRKKAFTLAFGLPLICGAHRSGLGSYCRCSLHPAGSPRNPSRLPGLLAFACIKVFQGKLAGKINFVVLNAMKVKTKSQDRVRVQILARSGVILHEALRKQMADDSSLMSDYLIIGKALKKVGWGKTAITAPKRK
jgi:hypothetical protein